MLKKLIKNTKTFVYWYSKGPYNPNSFWEKWGKSFIKEPSQRKLYPQHAWILKHIKETKPKNILEVGCGFGRNIKFIKDNYSKNIAIDGVDLSSSMLKNAKKFLSNDYKNISLRKADVKNLPFENSTYDLVLCHGVLMHIKPLYIQKAVKEMNRVCRKWCIVIEQNGSMPIRKVRKINYYTYVYDYDRLFKSAEFKVIEKKSTKDLLWYFLEKSHEA